MTTVSQPQGASDARWLRALAAVIGTICLLSPGTMLAQLEDGSSVSGIPGDGVMDFYYFPRDTAVLSSEGWITRPAGTLTVDTDGADFVTILVGGPDVSNDPACDLCNNGVLAGPNAAGFPLSTWIVGYANQSSQWIRMSPLDASGYVGILGQNANLPEYFPSYGLANYGHGLRASDFTRVFTDAQGEAWNVAYASNAGGLWLTNVTIVPEPNPKTLWLALALLHAALIRITRLTSDSRIHDDWVSAQRK